MSKIIREKELKPCPICGGAPAMTQRERLIELILNSGVIEQFFDYEEQEAERLADYLLENGVFVPPFRIGEDVYCIKP